MKAMILAAGFGERHTPLTRCTPKPMFPVMNRPILEHTLRYLKSHGFRKIVVNLHHLPDAVMDYFGDGSSLGLDVVYSREPEILGTAGGIKLAQSHLDDGTFLVVNSDILTDVDLGAMLEFHQSNRSRLTLALTPTPSAETHDPIELDPTGRIVHFVGASSINIPELTSRWTFSGIQIMEPEIFERIPEGRFCGTTDEIFPAMVEEGVNVFGYVHEGYWRDMGTRAGYLQLHRDIFDGAARLVEATGLEENAQTFIGKNCNIAPDAQVGPYAILGDGCTVGDGARIVNSVCWENAVIGARALVQDSILGKGARVLDGTQVDDQSLTAEAT